MIRKHLSILMLYSALAIMLGHNFIPHHHHFEQNGILSHHHGQDGLPHNHDSDDDDSDWGQFLANFNHGPAGLIFSTSQIEADSYTIKNTQTAKLLNPTFYVERVILDVRQNVPPYLSEFYNSHHYLPHGLRAPPSLIV